MNSHEVAPDNNGVNSGGGSLFGSLAGSLSSILPREMDTHNLFLYLGIAIFLIHFVINGISMDISLFGLLLIFIGFRKIELSTWIVVVLWILILLEILGSMYHLNRMFVSKFGSLDSSEKPKTKTKSNKKTKKAKKTDDVS